MLGQAGEEAS
jgi:hypothetical protein